MCSLSDPPFASTSDAVGTFQTAAALATMASAAAWLTEALRSPASVKYIGWLVYQEIITRQLLKYGGPETHRGPPASAVIVPISTRAATASPRSR